MIQPFSTKHSLIFSVLYVGHTLRKKILNFISFALTLTFATADFVLLLLGYYGQDLMRAGALHLVLHLLSEHSNQLKQTNLSLTRSSLSHIMFALSFSISS
jgi:hypothetical protein